eukprot:9490888-Pyramimonas_sp.AAC.1
MASPAEWSEIDAFIQPIPEPLPRSWKLSYGEWSDYVRSRVHSMPGEDGLPYGVWQIPDASRLLHGVYLTLFTDGVHELPIQMRRSLMQHTPAQHVKYGREDPCWRDVLHASHQHQQPDLARTEVRSWQGYAN